MGTIREVNSLGQSIWLDFISRDLLVSGQLRKLVSEGVSGVTSNPTIFDKAIARTGDYDPDIRDYLRANPNADAHALYEHLTVRDIQMAAEILQPVYDASEGMDGLVSLEASPHLAYDTSGTIAEVERLWRLVNRPNAMIKVPATQQGIPAIEKLVAEGININITLMFSMRHYGAVADAYTRGVSRNPAPRHVVSVASLFVSRIDTYVDKELERLGTAEALLLRGKIAVASSRLVYQRFREVFSEPRFIEQQRRGARVQRLLWGSTSTKNPAYSDVMYVEELIGRDTINTMPLETLNALLEHGRVRPSLEEGVEEAEYMLERLFELGIDLNAAGEQIQRDGVRAFADSYDQLFKTLDEKRMALAVPR